MAYWIWLSASFLITSWSPECFIKLLSLTPAGMYLLCHVWSHLSHTGSRAELVNLSPLHVLILIAVILSITLQESEARIKAEEEVHKKCNTLV